MILNNVLCGLLASTVAALAPQFAIAQAADVTLVLKQSPVIAYKNVVTVADAADVICADSDLGKQIAELDLDSFDDERQTIEITPAQIRVRMRLAGIDSSRIHFRGPAAITLSPPRIIQPQRVIEEKIVAAIASQFGMQRDDIRVGLIAENPVPAPWVELAESIADAMVVLPTQLPSGRTTVHFMYRSSGATDQSLDVDCRVTTVSEVLVARRQLAAGTVLEAADVQSIRRPLEDAKLRPVSLQQAIGKTTRLAIPMHAVLQISDINETNPGPVVKRNDLVDVLISRGGLQMRLKNARVLTPGAPGDTVQVVNPESKRTVTASVINKSLLEIR
jgi:flagella basal body P-ring formation protein FlgA